MEKDIDIYDLDVQMATLLLPLLKRYREVYNEPKMPGTGIPGSIFKECNNNEDEAWIKWVTIQDHIIYALQCIIDDELDGPLEEEYLDKMVVVGDFKVNNPEQEKLLLEYYPKFEEHHEYVHKGLHLLGKHFLDFWL